MSVVRRPRPATRAPDGRRSRRARCRETRPVGDGDRGEVDGPSWYRRPAAAGRFARERPGLAFSVVANPEFLREGRAVQDTLNWIGIVVGSDDRGGFDAMRELYRPLVKVGVPLLETDVRTAELLEARVQRVPGNRRSRSRTRSRASRSSRAPTSSGSPR